MADASNPVLVTMSGTGYRLVLLIALLGAMAIGWYGWCRTRNPSARDVWLGAVSILASLSLWTLFGGLAHLAHVDPRLWAAPLDRLLGVTVLVTLGWTLGTPDLGGRRWRWFLAAGFVVATMAYLGWAPIWAQAIHEDPTLGQEATGVARTWDLWTLVLALTVGVALWRGTRSPRWLIGVIGGLALGTLLELVVPLSAVVPAWSRLGTVVAGSFVVAAAVSQALALRPTTVDYPWPVRRRADPTRRTRPPSTPSQPPAAPAPGPPSAAAPVSQPPPPSPELTRVLSELEHQASAIGDLAAVVRDLSERIGALESPPVVAPSVVAPPAAAPVAAPDTSHDLTVAEVIKLESAVNPRAPGNVGPPVAPVAAAPTPVAATALQLQLARYEQALAHLPWGIMVLDATDHVACANPAAADLLHVPEVASGVLAPPLFPDPNDAYCHLHQLREQPGDQGSRREVRFESPWLRADLDALRDPVAGYLGTVVVLRPRADQSAERTTALMPALTEALRAPMTSILGYSELLSRLSGLGEDHVGRYLQRVDANLARMKVALTNLLTVLNMTTAPASPSIEPVDVEQAVRSAVDRANPQFVEKGVAVAVTVDAPLPPASGDEQAIAQIVDNLLTQAALRSPQGGDVTVSVALREDASGIRALVISIRDRGPQLADGAPGILEMDADGPGHVERTVIRLLVEQQGGRAWAEVGGQGAVFHVRLPVRRTG